MLSFDTNILVYAADRRAGAKHVVASGLMEKAAQLDAGLTEQSLIEFLNVAMRKARQPLQEAAQLVSAWLSVFPLLIPNAAVVGDTLHLLGAYTLSVWDARLLAVCAANGCHVLFSEDLQDNARYNGVRVLNPFVPRNADRILEMARP
ncbi:MAG TPA: PIN domain-containing protein [Rhizomicrobium sp.]|jgi:predicted nucleic acid-binding protein